jgi:hypothetical protein
VALITVASFPKIVAGGLLSSTASRILVANLILAGLVIAFVGLNVPSYLAGADKVIVNSVGVTLAYPRGREQQLRWDNQLTRVALLDYSAHPRLVRQRRSYQLQVPYVRGSWFLNWNTVIDGNLFDAILKAASSAGAEVRTGEGSSVRYGLSPVIHRITGAAPRSREPTQGHAPFSP